jgi:hypothetical protein
MAVFTPSGSGGLPSSPVTTVKPGTPTIDNVSLPLAGTEYSYVLPAGTQRFVLKLRSYSASLQLSYTLGQSGLVYLTLPPGTNYSEADILETVTITLYMQATANSQIVEIVSWA